MPRWASWLATPIFLARHATLSSPLRERMKASRLGRKRYHERRWLYVRGIASKELAQNGVRREAVLTCLAVRAAPFALPSGRGSVYVARPGPLPISTIGETMDASPAARLVPSTADLSTTHRDLKFH